MKKYKRLLIIVISTIILLAGAGILLYTVLIDENQLSIAEKKWIDTNSSNVISIAIPNDLPVFGSTGKGVFFDFVTHLTEGLGLNMNNNTVSYLSKNEGYRFEVTSDYDKNGLLMYKDHFVLVGKNNGIIRDVSTVFGNKPAVLSTHVALVKAYYNVGDDKITVYENYANITKDLAEGKVAFAIVPLNEYKDEIISNNINILSHISDLNRYYYLRLGEDKTINSIFTKEFNKYMEDSFQESYNKNNYDLFISNLNITAAEEDTLTNKVYKYGFAELRPFEILSSGEYGGITAEYLKSFSKFSNVEFTFKKYKNSTELAEAAVNSELDIYYNYYDSVANYIDMGALTEISYYVVAHNSIDLSLSNIYGLSNQTVYVLENSYLYTLIKDLEGINIITYSDSNELKSIAKKENIVVLDEYTYNYYFNQLSNDYSLRYKDILEGEYYSFRYRNDTDTLYKLFTAYTKTLDPQDIKRIGITSYNGVDRKGKIVGTIAKGLLAIVAIGIIIVGFFIKNTKKLKLNTKVKKEDRLKYIDLLTSLKNRNYYVEKIPVWNKNTVYPQACIVMDINRIKDLNDSYGHEEGDKQIMAVANVLIKTQIDNTEIMRTSGNEFLVYLVGYSEKQILSYMKKLVKAFKKLPYDFGVAMGFSMIEDDTKLIEDAFNEATIQMRENKQLEEENDKKY